MGRDDDDDATRTTLNGALVQVHADLFFPHGKGQTCSLITFFFQSTKIVVANFPLDIYYLRGFFLVKFFFRHS